MCETERCWNCAITGSREREIDRHYSCENCRKGNGVGWWWTERDVGCVELQGGKSETLKPRNCRKDREIVFSTQTRKYWTRSPLGDKDLRDGDEAVARGDEPSMKLIIKYQCLFYLGGQRTI